MHVVTRIARINEGLKKRSILRLPFHECIQLCSMTCSVFMGFLATLVKKGSRSSRVAWNGWVDENVEILISMRV